MSPPVINGQVLGLLLCIRRLQDHWQLRHEADRSKSPPKDLIWPPLYLVHGHFGDEVNFIRVGFEGDDCGVDVGLKHQGQTSEIFPSTHFKTSLDKRYQSLRHSKKAKIHETQDVGCAPVKTGEE